MKIALYILIALHGVIHLLGFLKGFNLYDFNGITKSISKPLAILWFISFILFTVTTLLSAIDNELWWLVGLIAVIVSQILILIFWQDAKFGSLPNIIILITCIVGYGQFSFTNIINNEAITILSKSKPAANKIELNRIKELPSPVQNWLIKSGINEEIEIENVYLLQDIRMKLKPEQTKWSQAKAKQYFTINPPAFNWSVDMSMNPILSIKGRDKFEDGKGEMLMKIASLFKVVDVKENEKINQAALQRYLAEIVWFPTAALSPNIEWEPIDNIKARATFDFKGTKESGIFYFNQKGDFLKFVTMRFKDSDDAAQKFEWIAEAIEWNEINGIRIPTKVRATWNLEDVSWTWLELEITELKYNIESQ